MGGTESVYIRVSRSENRCYQWFKSPLMRLTTEYTERGG